MRNTLHSPNLTNSSTKDCAIHREPERLIGYGDSPIAPVDVRWHNNVLTGIAMGPLQHHHVKYVFPVHQQSSLWTRSLCPLLSDKIQVWASSIWMPWCLRGFEEHMRIIRLSPAGCPDTGDVDSS